MTIGFGFVAYDFAPLVIGFAPVVSNVVPVVNGSFRLVNESVLVVNGFAPVLLVFPASWFCVVIPVVLDWN